MDGHRKALPLETFDSIIAFVGHQDDKSHDDRNKPDNGEYVREENERREVRRTILFAFALREDERGSMIHDSEEGQRGVHPQGQDAQIKH